MKARTLLGKMVNAPLGMIGLEMRRKGNVAGRQTLWGTLQQARRMGFEPRTVIDVGAATGTTQLYETFPRARHILVDPLEENEPFLSRTVSGLVNAEYIIAAATKQSGTVTINVHQTFEHSSVFREWQGVMVDGVQRTVRAVTLDELRVERGLQGPYLIKVDVQGAELDVLSGATEVLKDTECVVLEVCLLSLYIGGPELYDVVAFMKDRGFLAYDIVDCCGRPLDGAISHCDMTFVRESGLFRKDHSYATTEQRAALDQRSAQERRSITGKYHA